MNPFQSSLQPIEAILFDLGNVIFDLDIARATKNISSLLKLNTPRETVFEVIKKFETGLISTSLFINDILRLCPHTVQARDVIKAWNSMLVGMPLERIKRLRELKNNFSILLLSNNNQLHYDFLEKYLEEEHQITDFNQSCFHYTYYSHQIKLRKPNPEVFKFVVKASGIHPASTLFIDDIPENILAGKQYGFQTILYQPESDFMKLTSNLMDLKR